MSGELNLSANLRPIGGVSGIAPANPTGKQTQTDAHGFKQGEVLRGTILEMFADGNAKIDLPSGSAIAAMTGGNIRKGDTLMLKILETAPKLLLKVDSVGSDADTSDEDIVRMFGFAQTKENLALAHTLRRRRGFVNADDLKFLMQAFTRVSPELLAEIPLQDLAETLALFRELRITPDSSLIKQFYPLIFNTISPDRDVKTLRNLAKKMSPALQHSLDEFFNAISLNANADETLDRFSTRQLTRSGQKTIYTILREFLVLSENLPVSDALEQSRTAAKNLLELLESQSLYNALTSEFAGYSLLILFVQVGERVYNVRTEIEALGGGQSEHPRAFLLTVNLEKLGEIRIAGNLLGVRLNLSLSVEREKTLVLLEEKKHLLVNALLTAGYSVLSLAVHNSNDEKIGIKPRFAALAPHNRVNVIV